MPTPDVAQGFRRLPHSRCLSPAASPGWCLMCQRDSNQVRELETTRQQTSALDPRCQSPPDGTTGSTPSQALRGRQRVCCTQ
ncbi:unnamed protein product [Rangifer tarandus platyrhynchus]|uniref:Uncharacterized protein n=1 Tax=Rangifer tarandus platyrhynchus TaxID=3082113 RepID=A0AC59YWT6_RANTA